MVTNDTKFKRTLDEADNKKACQLSLYYLKKMGKLFSDEKNINSFQIDSKYTILLDLCSILKRLEQIDNITPSNHILNLIEVKLREINSFSSPKIDNELFNNYNILINYITILVDDILSFLNGNNNLNIITSLFDHLIMAMEYDDDFDDSNIDYYNDSAYERYIKETKDDYEFSAEEGYNNWFGK